MGQFRVKVEGSEKTWDFEAPTPRAALLALAYHEKKTSSFAANAWVWDPVARQFNNVAGGVWMVNVHGLVNVPAGVRLLAEDSVGQFGTPRDQGDTSAVVGLLGGAALGAAMAGPVGAVIGGVAGLIIGKTSKGVG